MAGSRVYCISDMAAANSETTESDCCSSSDETSSKTRVSFTVWMKSLVMQGSGCTVFNENGDVVYRMDNYDTKRGKKVYLMDLHGKVLFTILKKKLRLFGWWEGYKSSSNDENIWFRVKTSRCILRKRSSFEITMFSGKIQRGCYSIESNHPGKFDFTIRNSTGKPVAQATRKQTSSGVFLGDDVMSLVIEPQMEHSLVVALLAVYGSICRRI